jgi:ABC-type uncharacterized transport system permease subunit
LTASPAIRRVGCELAGAAWALIPALLRAYASTNEIITSLMLNYVAGLLLTYLIFDSLSYWRDLSSFSAKTFPQGKNLPDAASWTAWSPFSPSLAIPLGFLLAIVLGVLLAAMRSRTRRVVVLVFCLSGACAGLGARARWATAARPRGCAARSGSDLART